MLKILNLIKNLRVETRDSLSTQEKNLPVSGVTSDSREVKPGFIFVAIKGESQDGHRFISEVQERGVALIIGEMKRPDSVIAPYIQVKDSRAALAIFAAEFYGHPSRSMTVVGVTGTSGKTTTTYLLESIFNASGYRVGVIGTVNFRFGNKVYPSTHTTPGPVALQKLLTEMKSDGCDAVIMEVSSHALKQKRAAGIAFDGMVFTNLSPEHLDFHPDMDDYFKSKAILFQDIAEYSIQEGKKVCAAINEDDSYGKRLIKLIKNSSSIGPFSVDNQRFQLDLEGIRGDVDGIVIRSSLIGKFNAYNILAAVTLARKMDLDLTAIAKGIEALQTVPGRMEPVSNGKGIHVLVDYAHKSDALEKVLKTLRDLRKGHRLITVFGCGGDRDRKKRPVMGQIAVELSDYVWITSDNPRTENPVAIIEEIKKGADRHKNYSIEPDRKKAIHHAVEMAKKGDVILIAGKGHEDYQIIGTQKIHFDDREVASEALSRHT